MKNKGFSLIELMIVVVIIGIIASVAVPNYQSNVRKSSRSDGMTALLDIMRAQENYFANEYTYTSDLTDLNYPDPYVTEGDKYSIRAATCGAGITLEACVRLTATAIGSQAVDGNLTLDSRGNKTHKGNNYWIK